VIFGEQCTRTLKLKNDGALPTRIFVKTNDGRTIPFVNQDDLQKKIDEMNARLAADTPQVDQQELQDSTEAAAKEDNEFAKEGAEEERHRLEKEASRKQIAAFTADPFEEFLAQVQFKRTNEIEGYASTKISFTFVPYKLGPVAQNFTLFMENQDYCSPIPISLEGECVDVPIYVAQEEYNMNVVVYDQFYRDKIILHNRSAQPMKLQLFFPKSFKPYLEFNPTLGYIQGLGQFDIWYKFRPDRTIMTNCQRYLVKQDELPPKDEYEEFTMRIPVKVTGAN